jgi:hypothetical protein
MRKIHALITSNLVKSEGRRPVAIQTAFPLALSFQKTEPPPGLPRRYAPRNDEVGACAQVSSTFAENRTGRYTSTLPQRWSLP